ncbi:hypothetical protein CYMTET_20110 [Cymbomonas tetramitiformis]|uniref:Uncharacterized protein n=1 Tax=Cymbomonas tetramitiformis TaxID=36881 RepID=A0AAE0G619_9CHLO|nr:hypothetical protein CYMTET_20110 [Cymbomonas tetramitiformis]
MQGLTSLAGVGAISIGLTSAPGPGSNRVLIQQASQLEGGGGKPLTPRAALLLCVRSLLREIVIRLTLERHPQKGVQRGGMQLSSAFAGKLGAAGAFALIFGYTTEIFPTSTRSAALGACSLAARVGGIAAPQILTLRSISPGLCWFLVGGLAVAAAVSSMWLIETRGQPMHNTIEDALNWEKQRLLESRLGPQGALLGEGRGMLWITSRDAPWCGWKEPLAQGEDRCEMHGLLKWNLGVNVGEGNWRWFLLPVSAKLRFYRLDKEQVEEAAGA